MEHKEAFINSSYYQQLRQEISHNYRAVGHALDNYGVDMSKELKEALEGLCEAHRAVLEAMEVDNVKDNRADK